MWKKKQSLPSGFRYLILLVAVLMLVTASAFDTGPTPEPEEEAVGNWIPDGIWVGAFAGSDAISFGDTYATASYNGKMNLEVVAGKVEGSFTASGISSSENTEAYAIATFGSHGTLQGSSEFPTLLPTYSNFDFSINIKSSGQVTNTTLELNSGFSEVELDLVSFANCSSLSGNFDASAAQSMEAAGANVLHIKTEFTITRVDSIGLADPEAYQDELLGLLKAGDQLVADTLANQSLNGDDLWDLLEWASELDSGIAIDTFCATDKTGYYNSAIVGIIAKLVELAYAHPDWFSPIQLNQLAHAAMTVGAIGAGASNEPQAVDLTNKLEEIASSKLDELDKNPDCTMIYALYTTSIFLQDDALYIKSTNVMNAHQCQEL